jgi:hypothetical protein
MTAKKRGDIPPETAARALFLSDRVCCVCRATGKPIQIHHIDDDPANNSLQNLAILCFDCHRNTQIRGGFDRKLDSDQVILYRDDWQRLVAQNRARADRQAMSRGDGRLDLELITSVADIYRENEAYERLAMHYAAIGNVDLRDKYVDLALKKDATDSTIIFLRSLQGKSDQIPQDVIARQYQLLTDHEGWLDRARLLVGVRRYTEAAHDYVRGIAEQLEQKRFFTAAFYLKELASTPISQELFVVALREAREEGSIWWQIRAYQELGWHSELDAFLKEHKAEIESSDDLRSKETLLERLGSRAEYIALRKDIAKSESQQSE